jgi:predicted enzyme related to lactoylglutathione lyase
MIFRCVDTLVTIATLEIDKLVFFYTNFLGERPAKYVPNVYAEFQLPGMKLGIFKPKSSHYVEFQSSTKSTMSLCLEVDDLESAIAHLIALGYPPPGEIITATYGREIYAYDPDNNRIILHHSTN